jgi:hypothetical protein
MFHWLQQTEPQMGEFILHSRRNFREGRKLSVPFEVALSFAQIRP